MAKTTTQNIIDKTQELFDKLPVLPKEARDVIAKITPWIALIFGILGVLGGIAGLGLLTVFSPFAFMGGAGRALGGGVLAAILTIASSGLLLAAFPGTKKYKISGWNFLFWSEAVALLSAILAPLDLGGIVFTLIGFYLIFQIKSHYK